MMSGFKNLICLRYSKVYPFGFSFLPNEIIEGGYLVDEQVKLDILHVLNMNHKLNKIDFMEFIRIWGYFNSGEDSHDDDPINYDYSIVCYEFFVDLK